MQISPDLHLILASKSPRRSYLLEQAGIPFTIRTAEVAEVYPLETPALEVAPPTWLNSRRPAVPT